MPPENPKDNPDLSQQPKPIKKDSTFFIIFSIVGLLIAFGWILYLTNLGTLLKIPEPDLPAFKEKIAPAVFVFTLLYILILIFNFYLKNKFSEWSEKKSNAVIVVSAHERINPIRLIAKQYYDMNLGNLVYTSPLGIYKETGSLSPTRFFIFENINQGQKTGYSQWYEHYMNKITTYLHNREYQFFATKQHFLHGEPKLEPNYNPLNSIALKRKEEINMLSPEETEGSATE